jgi:branched-chain amino acid transport system permease protein
MAHFLQTLISGLSLGSIYALIALGYTMVYGIAKMLNFAHGDIIMVGAYAVITAVFSMGMPPVVAVLFSIVICAVLGVLVEFLAYRPLRQAPPLTVLITAIGVSYFLQSVALLIFGSEQKAFPAIISLPTITIGAVQIDGITLATLVITAIIMIALTLFINRTRLGKAMRAVSEDKGAAELMGISVNRTITITFAIGSALAAIASLFYGSAYVYIRPTTGAMPGIKAFTAAVFGGIGSIPGAMLGGILLGIIEQFSKTYISTLWADAIVFGVLVIVLVVKPTGLLGKKISEKV